MGTSAGEASDDLVSQLDPSVQDMLVQATEDVVELLEARLIRGSSKTAALMWLHNMFGIDRRDGARLVDLVYALWRMESADQNVVRERRDDLRRKYMLVFRTCIDRNEMKNAIACLDSLAKLDALVTPDVHLTLANVKVTNQTRSRVSELMGRMQQLAEQRAALVNAAVANTAISPAAKAKLNQHVIDTTATTPGDDSDRDALDGVEDLPDEGPGSSGKKLNARSR
jgi:hypothetical protein